MTTTAFDLVDNFVVLCRGALPEIAEGVSDGQPVEFMSSVEGGYYVGLAVGWSADQDPAVLEAEPEGLADDGRETVQIRSTLYVSTGDTENGMKPVRDLARSYFERIEAAVKANKRLGVPKVLNTYIRFSDLDMVQTQDGPSLTMQFTLFADAFQ